MNSVPRPVVAVTGVGAIIGHGIVKSLRAGRHHPYIVGIDLNDTPPGSRVLDVFEKKPGAIEDCEAYFSFWERIVRQHGIQLIIPGLELDMAFCDRQRDFFASLGVQVALNTPALIALTADKWNFGEHLAAIGYPTIPSLRPHSWAQAIDALGPAPLLLKPLQGNGSRGIVRLHDETDFDYWTGKTSTPWMLQRIVGTPDEEYTVASFGLGNGQAIGPLTLRRRLSSAGNTAYAEVVPKHDVIDAAVERLLQHFSPLGATNFQFRVEDGTAYLLEINPRFSSSNSLRTAFGFNEADMAIDFHLYGRTPAQPAIRTGAGWRYAEDFVIHAGHPV
jgi:carbamoyl-phosphate synthase large subunit